MNIRPRAGETETVRSPVSPKSGPFRKTRFLPWGCSCPRPTGTALARPRNTRAMPDPSNPDDDERKAKRNAYARAWRAANADKVKANNAAYRAANLEKIKAKDAAHRAANAEKRRAENAAYRAANREKLRAQAAARRAAAKLRQQGE